MVEHRLKSASATPSPKRFFTLPAMWAIYRASKGYPRKIVHLCHQSLLAMIIQNRSRAGWRLIRSCKKRIGASFFDVRKPWHPILLATVCLSIVLCFPIKFLWTKSDISNREDANVRVPVYPIPSQRTQFVETHVDRASNSWPDPNSTSTTLDPANNVFGTEEHTLAESPPPVTSAASIVPEDVNSRPFMFDDHDHTTVAGSVPAEPPLFLGEVVVKPGDTLGGLVQKVYGVDRNSLLKTVIEANPQIRDPDTIDVGHFIRFPAVPVKVKTPSICWWVVMDQARTLNVAMQKIATLSQLSSVPLQIIPIWSLNVGLCFQITSKGYYTSENRALSVVRMLPGQMAERSAIISNWPGDTVFYANPTFGGILEHDPNNEALN